MKKSLITFAVIFAAFSATPVFAQDTDNNNLVENTVSINQEGALKLAKEAQKAAQKLGKNVSIAVLNNSGVTILILKADGVGPHNSEASRRKAFTSLSTKTPSYILMQNAAKTKDARNLNTLPELLLLGGGSPIWLNDQLVGSIGVSGGGGGLNDHNIALQAVKNSGFSTEKVEKKK